MKKGLKLFSFFFVVFLLLAAIVTAFVATNPGTSGFMTRATAQVNCSSLKKGGSIACRANANCYWMQTTKNCTKKLSAGARCFGTVPCANGYLCKDGTCTSKLASTNIDADPKPTADPTKKSEDNVQKMDDTIITSAYVPPGWTFQKGFPVTQSATTKIPECPISPTVTEIGVTKVFANGVGFYPIKLCKVHGYRINSIKAKDFDDMFTAMKAAGFGFKSDLNNFRSYETQQGMHLRNPNGAAPPGGSNHERGLAVDISCFNTSGDRQAFKPWMFGKQRGLAHFEKAIAEHPCLRWIHNNAPRYRLLLQCDGRGDYGEIAVKTGGCETWHISPTGR